MRSIYAAAPLAWEWMRGIHSDAFTMRNRRRQHFLCTTYANHSPFGETVPTMIIVAAVLAAATAGPDIAFEFLGRTSSSGYDVAGAEIVAFDRASGRAFVVNALANAVDIVDISVPTAPVRVGTVSLIPYGGGLQSVAARDGLIALAVEATPKTDPGTVVFMDATGVVSSAVTVGALPDHVCFTPDGTRLIVCNEGEPDANYEIDPVGSISIIDVSGSTIDQSDVVTLSFDGLPAGTIDPSIRPFGVNAPSIGQDLEPEYAAVSADSQSVVVTLQEHSAVALVDLTVPRIAAVRPLGLKDHASGVAGLITAALQNPPLLGTTAAGQDILLGGFSGLWFDSIDPATGVITFLANPDRGPNCEPVNVDGDAALERPFPLPAFQPRVCTLTYNPATNELSLVGQTLLRKPDGSPMTGLPNVFGQSPGLANTDEQPCDLFGQPLAFDPIGADLEGIVRTSDGSMWMCDEYRPSIYRFAADGLMLARYVPFGANSYGSVLGTEALPAVYAQRRDNRGFEAIAVWNDLLYCFVQSPLDNPDVANDANSKASQNTRILVFNPATESVIAEYLYVLEGGTSDKMGDACASGPGRFLVVERDSAVGPASKKKIFEIDLAGATDLSTLPSSVAGPGGTLDRMTAAQLVAAGIVPVSKRVRVDLAAVGYAAVGDKVEGIAMRDASTIFVINDNDFQMQGTFNPATGLLTNNPNPASTVLGVVTFSGNGLDPTDQDGGNFIRAWPVFGAYMPDAVASFAAGGQNYFVTANEGDAREWGTFFDGTPVSTTTVVLDPQVFPGRAWLKANARLGRLQVRKDLGDLDGDGDYDRLVSYGARSFTIWDAQAAKVWDSGDQLEQLTAARFPANFNCSNTNNSRDNRSRQKGPEPEGVTVGSAYGKTYFFGCLERVGGVIAYSVDDPTAPVFQDYLNSRDFTQLPFLGNAGDLGTEGLAFIRAEDSPNGFPLLLASHEVSGTLSVVQINRVCNGLGDVTADCLVDGNDLVVLLAAWGTCDVRQQICGADLDGNGLVDGADLVTMLANWGS